MHSSSLQMIPFQSYNLHLQIIICYKETPSQSVACMGLYDILAMAMVGDY